MIDIDVEYERNKRPLTAMQKKKQQQYREKRNRVCALSKKHGKAYLAGDADDFYIRYNKKKASCAKKNS